MKRPLYSIIILQVLALFFLTGCNLYMDEESAQNGRTESGGDGYTAPKIIEDSICKITYQYNEQTIELDQRHRPFLTRYRGDEKNNHIEIFFADNVPAQLLPSRGQYLTTQMYDMFANGLCHQVETVEKSDGGYVAKAHMVSMDEVFKEIEIEGQFVVEGDTVNHANDDSPSTRAATQEPFRPRLWPVKKTGTRAGEESEDINWPYQKDLCSFNLTFDITAHDKVGAVEGVSNKWLDKLVNTKLKDKMTKIGKQDNDMLLCSNKSFFDRLIINGEIDGHLCLSYQKKLVVDFVMKPKQNLIDLHSTVGYTLSCGIGVSKAEANISLPILGGSDYTFSSNSPIGKSFKNLKLKARDYLIKAPVISPRLMAGPVLLTFFITPNVAANFFARFQTTEDKPIGLFFEKNDKLFEFGFHSEGNGENRKTWTYPRENEQQKVSNTWKFTSNCDSIDFLTGLELGAGVSVGIKAYESMEASVSAGVTATLAYDNNLYDRYHVPPVVELNSGRKIKPLPCEDAKFTFDIIFNSIDLKGSLNVKIFTIDLLKINIAKPRPLFPQKVLYLYPEFCWTSSEHVEELTNSHEIGRRVTIEKKGSSFFNPYSAPSLALYYCPDDGIDPETWKGKMQFIKTVKAENSTISFVDQPYTYVFSVPKDKDKQWKGNYYLLPYYQAGVIGTSFYYCSPTTFMTGGWGSSDLDELTLRDFRQVRVKEPSTADGKTGFAFKFNVYGPCGKADRYAVFIRIISKSGKRSSKLVNLGDMNTKFADNNYVFTFEGDEESYDVEIHLNSYGKSDGEERVNRLSILKGKLTAEDALYNFTLEEYDPDAFDFDVEPLN